MKGYLERMEVAVWEPRSAKILNQNPLISSTALTYSYKRKIFCKVTSKEYRDGEKIPPQLHSIKSLQGLDSALIHILYHEML